MDVKDLAPGMLVGPLGLRSAAAAGGWRLGVVEQVVSDSSIGVRVLDGPRGYRGDLGWWFASELQAVDAKAGLAFLRERRARGDLDDDELRTLLARSTALVEQARREVADVPPGERLN